MARRSNKSLIDAKLKSNALDSLERNSDISKNPARTKLPRMLTPFIGRQNELSEVGDLLARPMVRLVTLTGPAGTGKTRLSLAVAENQQSEFADGVYFVNLAPITRPEVGLTAIAQALGLHDRWPLSPLDKLQNFLRGRNILLVLDNFEQILDLGPAISELLMVAPRLKVLLTSRTILSLYGESVYVVPPLDVTELDKEGSLEKVSRNEAVRVFVQNARMVNSDFRLTEKNYHLVAALCHYLEGLPLSIELTAARTDTYPLKVLLERLETGKRLELLNSGFKNLPPRQQNLSAALEWSYQLLTQPEKKLFRNLGLFVGSCSLDAAQALDGDPASTFAAIESLLRKSLLQQVEAAPGEVLRFKMLETIREYALAKLEEAGELETARHTYNAYFIGLVEDGVPALNDSTYADWLKRFELDHSNILNVLDYLIEQEETEEAYHLGGDIWEFWWRWGNLSQGREYISKILALKEPASKPTLKAKLFNGAACLAMYQYDCQTAIVYYEQSIAIWRKYGPNIFLARALSGLAGSYRILGYDEKALQLNYESLALFRSSGEEIGEANGLCNIASQLLEHGRYEGLQEMLEKSVEIHTRKNYLTGIGRTKIYLGEFFWRNGDQHQGKTYLKEGLGLLRQVNHRVQLANALNRLGLICLFQGQTSEAEDAFKESVELSMDLCRNLDLSFAYASLGLVKFIQNRLEEAETLFNKTLELRPGLGQFESVVWALEGLAAVYLKKGEYSRVQTLLEESQLLRKKHEIPVLPHTTKFIMPLLQTYQGLVKPAEAKETPLKVNNPVPMFAPKPVRPISYYSASDAMTPLSKRENEVLQLMAQGHQTSEIAQILVISPGTVNNHLNSIYSKLGVNSRTSAVRFALDNGLLT